MSVERNTQQCHRECKHYCNALLAFAFLCKIYTVDECACKDNDIYYQSGVEWQVKNIYKQQFKPSAHFHNSGDNSVKEYCHYNSRNCQSQQRAFEVCLRIFLVIYHQYYGWDTEQVEQVYSDRESHKVCYEHQPAVAVWGIGILFPFKYKPEYNSSEQ